MVEKQEAIREAAIKVMAREGFYHTRMHTIAAEAGIAIGTVYLYFQSKEDILNHIFMVEYKKRLEFMEQLKKSKLPYLRQIRGFLSFHLNQLKRYPDVAKVLIQEAVDPALHKLKWIRRTFCGIARIFKELLDKAKLNGEVRDIDTELIGSTIFFSSRALAYKLQIEGRESEYEYALDQFTSFIIQGIKK